MRRACGTADMAGIVDSYLYAKRGKSQKVLTICLCLVGEDAHVQALSKLFLAQREGALVCVMTLTPERLSV